MITARQEARWESTVREQRENNPWVVNMDKSRFIAQRKQRDATLPHPELMLMALQVNIRGGVLPDCEDDGQHYLKIPRIDLRDESNSKISGGLDRNRWHRQRGRGVSGWMFVLRQSG